MAIVKFVTSDCPMNNIFPYVMRKEATEQRLISGIECSPDTALEEFRYVKQKYGKEDGRADRISENLRKKKTGIYSKGRNYGR